jgi:hypothetical protein
MIRIFTSWIAWAADTAPVISLSTHQQLDPTIFFSENKIRNEPKLKPPKQSPCAWASPSFRNLWKKGSNRNLLEEKHNAAADFVGAGRIVRAFNDSMSCDAAGGLKELFLPCADLHGFSRNSVVQPGLTSRKSLRSKTGSDRSRTQKTNTRTRTKEKKNNPKKIMD